MSSLLNPCSVILPGRLLAVTSPKAVRQACTAYPPRTSVPPVVLPDSFSGDYQDGMIADALACPQDGPCSSSSA